EFIVAAADQITEATRCGERLLGSAHIAAGSAFCGAFSNVSDRMSDTARGTRALPSPRNDQHGALIRSAGQPEITRNNVHEPFQIGWQLAGIFLGIERH